MTTEIEKKFFKAFGIRETSEIDLLKPEYANQSVCKKCEKNKYCADYCDEAYEAYPEITDRILLELNVICLNNDFVVHSKNLNELQEKILYLLTHNANNKDIFNAVRKLFEVGSNDKKI